MSRSGVIAECEFMAGFDRLRFCEVLDECGQTQKELEKTSGISQEAISQIRTGRTIEPSASSVFRIADAAGVNCEEFRKPVGSPIKWLPGRKPKQKPDD